MKFGTLHKIPPEPVKAEDTHMVEAGVLRFGVEPRRITFESMRASYAKDSVALARFDARGQREINDGGVSIHVFGADDGHEYLRFDCFDEEPHYHYNHRVGPGEDVTNQRVSFDPIVGGAMLPWALKMLGERLPQMLTQARGSALAARVDNAAVGRALDEVSRLAKRGLICLSCAAKAPLPLEGDDMSATLEDRIRRLEDRDNIRDLTHRYCDFVWRRNGAAIADLFTDDGAFIRDGQEEVRGREAVTRLYVELPARGTNPHPYIHNHVIDLNGDTATGTCYIDNRLGEDGTVIGGGYYEDEFRRTPQGWKFVTRRSHPVFSYAVTVRPK